MKTLEKPKYSIWQNLCFSVKLAWKTRKRVLLVCVVMAVIGVLLNLASRRKSWRKWKPMRL